MARLLSLAALVLMLASCITAPVAPQQPTLANIQVLRTAGIPALGLGEFRLAEGQPARMDRSISVRGNTLTAPQGGTFSAYLRQTIETELRGAGKYDPEAGAIISADLTQSAVASNLPNGNGTLGAHFRVTRAGVVVFDRELVVRDEWASNFIGAIAIPEAMDRYTALYPALVTALLNDPDFQASVR